MCKVSVIIPVYNVENYLRECLNSVVNQTLQDIEVICVDDGSTDRSAEIVAEYAEKYGNFKLIRKENAGQSSARNVALENAQGEYIYFLDSDDYIHPCTLKEVCEKADGDELDIVYFNAVPVFENDKIRKNHQNYVNYYTRNGNYSECCTGQTMFAKMRGNREFYGSPCLQIFRRRMIENNSLRFYEGIIHEDNLFTFQSALLAKKAGYIDKAYYYRRIHDNSTMTQPKSMRNVEGYIITYYEALAFLHDIELQEDAVQAVSDYLYHALYRNACNIWYSLTLDERKSSLSCGGACAGHLLYVGIKSIEAERSRDRLEAENKQLIKQLTLVKQDSGKKVALWGNQIAERIKGFFLCASQHGYRYAVRRAVKKITCTLRKIFPGKKGDS